MTILALDLGTSTGYAMQTADGNILSGSVSFKQTRFDGGGVRFLRFKKWLTEIKQSGVTEVCYESVRRHVSNDSAHCYGAFMGILTAWCEHHEIPYTGVPVGTIKKHATGKGNASKEQMIQAAIDKGFSPKTHDEADAIHILLYSIKG